jgi:hypothetical protein
MPSSGHRPKLLPFHYLTLAVGSPRWWENRIDMRRSTPTNIAPPPKGDSATRGRRLFKHRPQLTVR